MIARRFAADRGRVFSLRYTLIVCIRARLHGRVRARLGKRGRGRFGRRRRAPRVENAEDRQREALVLPLSVQENLLLKDYRVGRFRSLGWLRLAAWRGQARNLVQNFDIRTPSVFRVIWHIKPPMERGDG